MKRDRLIRAALIPMFLFHVPIASAQTADRPQAAPTQSNPFEPVPAAPEPSRVKRFGPTIEAIDFHGARRIPADTLRALIASRAGESFDRETLQRDTEALFKTGRFSDISVETEPGRTGTVVRFTVVERPLIASIEYQGSTAVTAAEFRGLLEERNIRVRVGALYNEEDLRRAVTAMQELLDQKGIPNVTVAPGVERIPPASVKITFTLKAAP